MIQNKDLLLSPKKIFDNVKELLDNYRETLNIKDKHYYKTFLESIRNANFWNASCAADRICMHIYKNGKRAGEICGNKIFIIANNRLQEYLCSRHCRDYETKGRTYDKKHGKCNYIRKNKEECKHRCANGDKYCYMHKKFCEEEDLKKIFIKNLEKKRKKYKKLKKRKQNLYAQILTREYKKEIIKKYDIASCTSNGNADHNCVMYDRTGIT